MIQQALAAIGLLCISYNIGTLMNFLKYYLIHKKFPMKEKDILIKSLEEQNVMLKQQLSTRQEELQKLQNIITESLI